MNTVSIKWFNLLLISATLLYLYLGILRQHEQVTIEGDDRQSMDTFAQTAKELPSLPVQHLLQSKGIRELSFNNRMVSR